MILFSFIVPVYNVSNYLSKCLDSLLCQDLANNEYEIIVVNDGSTDESGSIARQYAEKYASIRLVEQANAGLSAARNAGIQLAKGKYIQFVDSDDYLEPNVLCMLAEKMEENNLDILRINYQNVNERYEVFEPNKVTKPYVDYRDEIVDGLTFLTDRLGYACYAWQFIIKAELIQQPQNRFREGIYFEDTEWTPRLLVQAKRVTSCDRIIYNYLMRSGSITQSTNRKHTEKLLHDKLFLIDAMQWQAQSQTDQRWFRGMIAATVISIFGTLGNAFYTERNNYLKHLFQKQVFPLSYYHTTRRVKAKLVLINISPKFYCWLLHKKLST